MREISTLTTHKTLKKAYICCRSHMRIAKKMEDYSSRGRTKLERKEEDPLQVTNGIKEKK